MSQPKSNEEIIKELKDDWLESSGVSVIEFIELFVGQALAQKDAEVAEAVKAENKRLKLLIVEYFEKGLGFNRGSINDSLFQDLKEGLLKTITPDVGITSEDKKDV